MIAVDIRRLSQIDPTNARELHAQRNAPCFCQNFLYEVHNLKDVVMLKEKKTKQS